MFQWPPEEVSDDNGRVQRSIINTHMYVPYKMKVMYPGSKEAWLFMAAMPPTKLDLGNKHNTCMKGLRNSLEMKLIAVTSRLGALVVSYNVLLSQRFTTNSF